MCSSDLSLPPWLSAIIGHLGLPSHLAQTLGADLHLFEVVQTAVLLAQHTSYQSVAQALDFRNNPSLALRDGPQGLALAVGATLPQLQQALNLSCDIIDEIVSRADSHGRLRPSACLSA